MDEEIVAPIVRGNKTVPLLIIKPLYRTCCHVFLLIRFYYRSMIISPLDSPGGPEGYKDSPKHQRSLAGLQFNINLFFVKNYV
jgi:hypothetical protein